MDTLIAPGIATGREGILCWPSAEPHFRTLDAVAQPLDLAALQVCGPACGGRSAKVEHAGPAVPCGGGALIQNLRRYLSYDVQYFAAVEPQNRLASHIHIATRGTISRAEIRRVLAATYQQVWWPTTNTVKYDGDQLPVSL